MNRIIVLLLVIATLMSSVGCVSNASKIDHREEGSIVGGLVGLVAGALACGGDLVCAGTATIASASAGNLAGRAIENEDGLDERERVYELQRARLRRAQAEAHRAQAEAERAQAEARIVIAQAPPPRREKRTASFSRREQGCRVLKPDGRYVRLDISCESLRRQQRRGY